MSSSTRRGGAYLSFRYGGWPKVGVVTRWPWLLFQNGECGVVKDSDHYLGLVDRRLKKETDDRVLLIRLNEWCVERSHGEFCHEM